MLGINYRFLMKAANVINQNNKTVCRTIEKHDRYVNEISVSTSYCKMTGFCC